MKDEYTVFNRSEFQGDFSLSDIPAYIENQESLNELAETIENSVEISLTDSDKAFLLKLYVIYGYSGEQILELYQFGKARGKLAPAYLEKVVKSRLQDHSEPVKPSPVSKKKQPTDDYSAFARQQLDKQKERWSSSHSRRHE